MYISDFKGTSYNLQFTRFVLAIHYYIYRFSHSFYSEYSTGIHGHHKDSLLPLYILFIGLITARFLIHCQILEYTHTLYIWGFPVQQTVVHFNGGKMNPYMNFAVSVPVIIVLAVITHKTVKSIESHLFFELHK